MTETMPAFHDAEERSRFELDVSGQVAYADYQRRPGVLVISYVYAPPPLRGTGASDRLMSAVAEQARAEDRKILALCGYARGWLRAHRAHRDLLVS
ncbi:GNAT family N-acetyltransferase [Enterovirga sp. CN4-39]|uniref:GNAT family N-acetyltransferase n=1 Tax=Enterovirga sp. CN4-39 TaxID=3400910 RepID=UPI003C0DF5F8